MSAFFNTPSQRFLYRMFDAIPLDAIYARPVDVKYLRDALVCFAFLVKFTLVNGKQDQGVFDFLRRVFRC